MAQVVVIYSTFPDKAVALGVARIMVQEKLAACVNILPGMQSVYSWEGKLEEADEVVMIAKTASEQAETLMARIALLHPYSCPCIVSVAVDGGHPDFLSWVRECSL